MKNSRKKFFPDQNFNRGPPEQQAVMKTPGLWWSSGLDHQPHNLLVMLKVEGSKQGLSETFFCFVKLCLAHFATIFMSRNFNFRTGK